MRYYTPGVIIDCTVAVHLRSRATRIAESEYLFDEKNSPRRNSPQTNRSDFTSAIFPQPAEILHGYLRNQLAGNSIDCPSPINYPIRANRLYRSSNPFHGPRRFRRPASERTNDLDARERVRIHTPLFLFDFQFCTPAGQIFRVIPNISAGRSNMCRQRRRFHGDLSLVLSHRTR